MTQRIFDFRCNAGHVTERYISDEAQFIECPECKQRADRLISAPMFKFDPKDLAFGTYYRKWGQQRNEYAKIANKRYREHGEDTYL